MGFLGTVVILLRKGNYVMEFSGDLNNKNIISGWKRKVER